MNSSPRLSYIVLSYNYEQFIGRAIESILQQTVQDFEVVVVDDCSNDRSCEVIEAFRDDRIRLLRNAGNLGGAASYNRAVEAARGDWLVNLDADDWILPAKAAAQLAMVAADPKLDVLGTWVSFVDSDGLPHREADRFEAETNRHWNFNSVSSWIGRNALCRSSAMVRRSAHLRVGYDDERMVRAPDYELWTRALRHGCRFAVLPDKLTCYRLHERSVTHQNRAQTFLEMAWAAYRNLLPIIERDEAWADLSEIYSWITSHEELANLPGGQRERLLGLLFLPRPIANYAEFERILARQDLNLEALGRRMVAFTNVKDELRRLDRQKLMDDIRAYTEARDFWRAHGARVEAEASALRERCRILEDVVVAQAEAPPRSPDKTPHGGSRSILGKCLAKLRRTFHSS